MDYFYTALARAEYEERVRNWQLERSVARRQNNAFRQAMARSGDLLVSLGTWMKAHATPVPTRTMAGGSHAH